MYGNSQVPQLEDSEATSCSEQATALVACTWLEPLVAEPFRHLKLLFVGFTPMSLDVGGNPKGPRTQICWYQVPKPMVGAVLVTEYLCIWVLGPSGKVSGGHDSDRPEGFSGVFEVRASIASS